MKSLCFSMMTGRKKAETWIASRGTLSSQTFTCAYCGGEKGMSLAKNNDGFIFFPQLHAYLKFVLAEFCAC